MRKTRTRVKEELSAEHVASIRHSGLLDAAWFLDRHPEFADTPDLSEAVHRIWRDLRWPNPYFDPRYYLASNPDVAAAQIDPLVHYIQFGEAEGRRPVEFFEPTWYRLTRAVPPDTLALTHFLTHRHGGVVSPIPEFDAEYYLVQAPDVAAAGMDPFEHYLVRGAQEGRACSTQFDTAWYRARYLGHSMDVNPLLHWRANRHRPHVYPRRPAHETDIPTEIRRNTARGPHFEEARPNPPGIQPRAKVLAFYLPQFHDVPENDAWWGRGFTEWTNTARGVPRFAGHYQPRIPRDLGHYRLDGTATLRRQAALAQGAGIHGFVFYYYWFNGRRLLESPLEALLADPEVDLPFCLMWANENWTRRWDGSEQDVLIAQDYRAEDGPALVADLVRHFRDPRYIRLDGRPVLMVYRAAMIPDTARTVAGWRRAFAAVGEDPVFVMAQTFGATDPRAAGMDAAVEFPPHKLTEGLTPINHRLQWLDSGASARVFDYDAVAASSDLSRAPYRLIRTAVPGWDNDARRQGAGLVMHGATPAAYQSWLERLITAAAAQPVLGEAIVCVNAWNEWAEGAYLEPDVHCGAAYLNATARAIAARTAPSPGRVDGWGRGLVLVGHDAFPAGAQLLLLHIGRQLRETGEDVRFLLLGDGALLSAYEQVAPTIVIPGADAWPAALQGLQDAGIGRALVNSAASSDACVRLSSAGVTCTLLVHELPRLLRERGLVEPVRAAVAAATQVVFAANEVRDRFDAEIADTGGRSHILPQGLYGPVDATDRLDRRARLGVPEGGILAVGVGYADLRKGFDLFLQVWRHAQPSGAHALWVGAIDPVVQAYLGPEIEQAQATGTFHLLPWTADGAAWLAAADMHLLTAREDPFPSVVLEAMSAGVQTLAFAGAGGAPGLLQTYGAGQSVALGDAAAMARLLRPREPDPALADRTRHDFDFAAYVDRLLHLTRPALRPVSAVVPNYNYARFLPERLGSLFAQTHAPAEILVLDDASTDDSAAVVRAVAAGRAVAWHANAVNSGSVFAQWRRAAELAVHDWLWIAEADDAAEPAFLETLCQALDGAPDAVMAFSDSRAVDAAGTPLWPDHQAYYARAGAGILTADGVFPAMDVLQTCLADRNLILNASGVLFRRAALLAALDRCGAELPQWRMAGDWRLYAELLVQGGSVVYVARPLNIHRRHTGSVTHAMPADAHIEEVSRMQRHMRTILAPDPAREARQIAALADAASTLRPIELAAHTSIRLRSKAGLGRGAARSGRNGDRISRRNSPPP